jgi:hypothetical protein
VGAREKDLPLYGSLASGAALNHRWTLLDPPAWLTRPTGQAPNSILLSQSSCPHSAYAPDDEHEHGGQTMDKCLCIHPGEQQENLLSWRSTAAPRSQGYQPSHPHMLVVKDR